MQTMYFFFFFNVEGFKDVKDVAYYFFPYRESHQTMKGNPQDTVDYTLSFMSDYESPTRPPLPHPHFLSHHLHQNNQDNFYSLLHLHLSVRRDVGRTGDNSEE